MPRHVPHVPPGAILLPYQQRWVLDPATVKVAEKSRRTGFTWASAAGAVMAAAAPAGGAPAQSTFFLSYAETGALEFIRDVVRWAEYLTDVPYEARAHAVEFPATGKRVEAFTSSPTNVRGKQGRVVIDEAAFHPDLPGLLQAATPLLMWGGSLEVISTHQGVMNPFNQLVKDVRSGSLPYSLHRVTLDDALDQGLYTRIAALGGLDPSPQAQVEWRAAQIAAIGRGADEELFCVPSAGASGLFRRGWFQIVDVPPDPTGLRMVRGWDLAGTAPKPGRDPDWTRGALLGLTPGGQATLLDVASVQGSPAQVRELVLRTAQADGPHVEQALWTDPGAAGLYVVDDLTRALAGYHVTTERAARSKVEYATPVSVAAESGRLSVLRAPWTAAFLAEAEAFPGGSHDDQVDAVSRAWLALASRPAWSVGYEGDNPPSGGFGWR